MVKQGWKWSSRGENGSIFLRVWISDCKQFVLLSSSLSQIIYPWYLYYDLLTPIPYNPPPNISKHKSISWITYAESFLSYLSNPIHPKQRWRCMAVQVGIGHQDNLTEKKSKIRRRFRVFCLHSVTSHKCIVSEFITDDEKTTRIRWWKYNYTHKHN